MKNTISSLLLIFYSNSLVHLNPFTRSVLSGGANLIPFSALGKKVSGIELSPEMVRYANKHKLNVKEGTINEIEKGFDLYIIQHVLEHVFDLSEFLKKLREKKVKRVFVGVPGFYSMVPSIQIAHNFYFSPNTLPKYIFKVWI